MEPVSDSAVTASTEDHFRALALQSGWVALSGFAGAVCVLAGLDKRIVDRPDWFPFDNALLDATTLIAVVGAPNALIAGLASRRDRRSDHVAIVAGGMLIGWGAIEIFALHRTTNLDPFYAAAGAALIINGLRGRLRSAPAETPISNDAAVTETSPSGSRSRDAIGAVGVSLRPLQKAALRVAHPFDARRRRATSRRFPSAP